MSLKQKLVARGYQDPNFSNDAHKELYDRYFQYLDDVAKDEKSILEFMKFTGQVYKYPFQDALFIYGQNPNSTFLADFDTWKKIGRNVKRGEKAIHSLTFENGKYKQKYFFDVTQTAGKEHEFPDWKFEEDVLERILSKVEDSVGEEPLKDKSISERIENICNIYYKQVEKQNDYGKLAIQSSKFILRNKLGVPTDEKEYYSVVSELVDNPKITAVMKQVMELNQNILRSLNEFKNEVNTEKGLENDTISRARERNIDTEDGRLPEQRTAAREIRKNGSELSGEDELRGVLPEIHQRPAHDIRPSSGGGSVESSRETDSGNAGERSDATDGRYASENETSQSNQTTSGRNRDESSDLQPKLIEQEESSKVKNEDSSFILDKEEDQGQLTFPEFEIIDAEKERELESKYDYSFPVGDTEFYGATNKEKIQNNIAAIRLLKQLEKSDRLATPEEQEVLAQYVGWGGLADVFDDRNNKYSQEAQELKQLLSEEEYQSARESVLTAYYTDPIIVQKMYDTLQRMGFDGGKVLDPAMGTGNFFSAMPEQLKKNSSLYGVELDQLTGKMAKHLHQSANVQVKGFEETKFKNNSFDVVVGNIPFDNFRIKDSSYEREYQIHDYFIKKSLDLVRDDGIVAFISSTGTMDKGDYLFRLELSKQADLLGAVRLPNNAFKQIAGTEVTTDILLFKKVPQDEADRRSKLNWITPNWVFSGVDQNHPTITYNNYFIENQDQVLGDIGVKNFRGKTLTVNPKEGQALYPLLAEGLQNIQGEYKDRENTVEIVVEDEKQVPANVSEEVDLERARPYTFVAKNKEIYYIDEDGPVKQELSGKASERVLGMIGVRQAVLDVIEYQQNVDYQSDTFQQKLNVLNETYDTFVKKNGYLNAKENVRVFKDDDMSPLLLSIENKTKDGEYEKADIFRKATIRPAQVITEVNTAVEALNLSISRNTKIDMEYIQSLYPKDKEEIMKELDGYIFINPEKYSVDSEEEDYWETKDEYLTGNVKEKLKQAETAVQEHPELFSKNVKELQAVIPEDLQPSEIDYQIGSTWIPEKYYKQFMFETFQTPAYARSSYGIQLEYNQYTDAWFIKGKTLDSSVLVHSKYGTGKASAYKIFEDSLNLKNTEVRDPETYTDSNGQEKVKYVLNPSETMLAREKQDQMQEAFKSWLFQDPGRAKDLLRIYNDRFNCIRPRTYDGSKLQFNGMSDQFELRSHQKDVVARILHNGRALMAHEVGAGKTASMISAGMMMKEQGMIQKPLYVVPNHLTQQFGQELLRFYPSKNVLITTKDDFKTQNRKKFVSRIATGDYDAVIIGHSQFEKIAMSKEYREEVTRNEVKGVQQAIEREKSNKGESWSLKQMVRFEKNLKKQLTDLQNEKNKDGILTFEQLGVDFMFVDEAHIYKNLYTYTKLSNVAGVNTSSSLRASDMQMKCQYLLEKNNGRGVVFATGTPISNSMSEMYTMQRYLQPDVLRQLGVESFDSWASTFGEVTSSLEITPEGSGYQMKNRFAKFHNLPELMNSFNLVSDIQTADMLKLPVPDVKGGKAKIVVTEATDYQMNMMDEFVERAEAIRAKAVQPNEDNMLKLTHEAKLMAIDPRLLDETAPPDSGSKLSVCSQKVYNIWKSSSEQKSTQMIFSDSGTPKPGQFNVYDEMKRQLVEKGIPEKEIAFIHDAKTDQQRDTLFDKVRKGEVRVLLGSTSKVGTGTNVQNKLLAVHHIDCPWRPSDLTQRDGRIVRQGNENKEVQIYRYVTKNSFDSYLWQIQEQKLRYISQVMTGKSISRSCDDLDETVLSAAEVKAVATGNPLLAEKMNLDIEVTKLRLMKSSWTNEQVRMKRNVTSDYPMELEVLQEKRNGLKLDQQTVEKYADKEFSIELAGKVFTERTEAAKALEEFAIESATTYKKVTAGTYKGLQLTVAPSTSLGSYSLELKGESSHKVTMYLESGIGTIRKLENEVDRIPKKIEEVENTIESVNIKMVQAKQQMDEPFKHEERLEMLLKRQNELNLAIELGTSTLAAEKTEEQMGISEPKEVEITQNNKIEKIDGQSNPDKLASVNNTAVSETEQEKVGHFVSVGASETTTTDQTEQDMRRRAYLAHMQKIER